MRVRALLTALVVALGACSFPTTGDAPTAAPSSVTTPVEAEDADAVAPDQDVTPAPAPFTDMLFVRVEFDQLTDAAIDAIAALDGVSEVQARRTNDVALWSSARSDGTPVDALPEDFKISVSVVVDDQELPVHPGPGEVVLTEAGRQFRDLDVGATVSLADRIPRTVVAITDAPELADVEFVVDESDADAMDVRERQRAVVVLSPDADVDGTVAAVHDILGENGLVQRRRSDDRPMVLSLPATKARFGEFAFKDLDGRDIQAGVSWIDEYIVTAEVPIIGRVVCNRIILGDLAAALTEVQDAGLANEIDPALYGGCWAPRRINRNANLSRHAWGIAIDINVDFNAPGLGPIPTEDVIEAFEANGFRWGGDYPIPDNHHFEWVGQ